MKDLLLEHVSNLYKPNYIKNYENFDEKKDSVLYNGPYWDHQELYAILNTILNGDWIVSGDNVEKFEIEFSKKFNVKFSRMVNSGSSANLVMITALKKYFKWQDDDEIIVSPVGFPTTIAPIIQNKLFPRFVDIEFNTLNFDINQIEDKITNKTKAIFVSPVLGNPPDLDVLYKLAKKYNILLIGDNCDSLGSKINNKYIHEYYYVWSCSFYPAHHITTGEGGMVSSNNENLIDLVKSISWWGRDCYCVGKNNLLPNGTCGKRFDYWLDNYDGIIDHKYVYGNIGYNLKPLDFQGAIGSIQLLKFDEISEKRKRNKNFIHNELLKNIDLDEITQLSNAEPCWFGIPVLCKTSEQKEFLVQHLEHNRIQTRNYFGGNMLLHNAYSYLDDYKKYTNANKTLDLVFFIGCSPSYNEKVLNYIKKVIESW